MKPTDVVYLIGNADNRLVKIGTTSKHSLERLSGIQTMSPSILTVLWTTPGDKELEHKLHYRFRAERRHGEWFDFGGLDPVATVSAAAAEINNVADPAAPDDDLHPLDALWIAMDVTRNWYGYEASPQDRNQAPTSLKYVVGTAADIVEALATGQLDNEARLPDALAALHLAEQRLGGATYPNVAGLASPRTLVAMAANAHWAARCMAGAVEDDEFSLYAPQQIADFAKEVSGAVRGFAQTLKVIRLAMRDAEQRGDIPTGSRRALDDVTSRLYSMGDSLAEVAEKVRALPYRGYVDRGEAALFEAIVDELHARGLEPETRGNAAHITFIYHLERCSLEYTGLGWAARWTPESSPKLIILGAFAGAGHHPGQIVSKALRELDEAIGAGPFPVEPETPQYAANPNVRWRNAPRLDDDDENEGITGRNQASMDRVLAKMGVPPAQREAEITHGAALDRREGGQ